jgi:hypothetical protein
VVYASDTEAGQLLQWSEGRSLTGTWKEVTWIVTVPSSESILSVHRVVDIENSNLLCIATNRKGNVTPDQKGGDVLSRKHRRPRLRWLDEVQVLSIAKGSSADPELE